MQCMHSDRFRCIHYHDIKMVRIDSISDSIRGSDRFHRFRIDSISGSDRFYRFRSILSVSIDSIGFGAIISVSDRFYRFRTDSICFGPILSVSDRFYRFRIHYRLAKLCHLELAEGVFITQAKQNYLLCRLYYFSAATLLSSISAL